ncbi:MAG: DUF4160 domain-containing protein [Candidatus Latescibacteria bacterium]|nr:DUF4160 domain-containing protein [Candidatus Latescibacterota bacterium]MBT5828599.1 DUF4160 domain-containing protein [Candidatus Latescibacterota bacterium]
MPTIKDIRGPYRFFFYSFDCNEPRHVHVKRDRKTCKFWIDPISLCKNWEFSPHELNQIHNLIQTHYVTLVEAWHEHCG